MTYNPDIHHRRSIRLKDYDYSQLGAYFVTICTHNRECLFGEIVNSEMELNDAGKMVEKWYFELTKKFHSIQCDEHVVMPNHFHCIIQNVGVVGADPCVCPGNDGQTRRFAPTNLKLGEHTNHMGEHINHMGEHTGSPLRNVIQWFKTMTTNEYVRHVKNDGWKRFNGKLWQRNYYEHIIRNECELNQIREYIVNNPLKWDLDNENPRSKSHCRGRPMCLPR